MESKSFSFFFLAHVTNLMDEFDRLLFLDVLGNILFDSNQLTTAKKKIPSKSNHQNDAKRCANIQMGGVVGWKLRWVCN